jgi:23S rRNA C2498 (ribose-2'-O)-methylase RlmM
MDGAVPDRSEKKETAMNTELDTDLSTDKMILAHEAEADRVGAKIWNHGWVGGDDYWLSKTSHGLLETKISKSGKITHKWEFDFNVMSDKGKMDWVVSALVEAVLVPSDRKARQMIKKIEECCLSGLSIAQVYKCKKEAKKILITLEVV